jgi:fumarylacetoacetase
LNAESSATSAAVSPGSAPAADPFAVAHDDPFGPHNLPYGVFSTAADPAPRLGVRLGGHVLDAGAAARLLGAPPEVAGPLAAPVLNPLLAAGRPAWTRVRAALTGWLTDPQHRAVVRPLLVPLDTVTLHLPFEVADYVDFYASEHHAANVGRLFRPGADPLPPNWKHLPVGYHGRAGTVVVSGSPVVRPCGQRMLPGEAGPSYGPSLRLDVEAELGFVVGGGTGRGTRVALHDADEHVFGVCLLNDWSARDIQAWEYVPLGPFLGKSFATSVSPWVVPLDALAHARTAPPVRDTPLLPYLDDGGVEPPCGLDVAMELRLNGQVLTRPPFASMYWTYAQMVAHMTVNGAALRAGDLFGSGTVSGAGRGEVGALIELTRGGVEPVVLGDGSVRAFLEDGDEVTITGSAPGPGGVRVGLGAVTGRVEAAR